MKTKFTKIIKSVIILAISMLALVACSKNVSKNDEISVTSQSETSTSESTSDISSSSSQSELTKPASDQSEKPQSKITSSKNTAPIAPQSQATNSSNSQGSTPTQEKKYENSHASDSSESLEEDKNNIYLDVISCSLDNDVITVTFSADADQPTNEEIEIDVWLSDDNGIGGVKEIFYIDNHPKEYSLSMQSDRLEGSSYFQITLRANTAKTGQMFSFWSDSGEVSVYYNY